MKKECYIKVVVDDSKEVHGGGETRAHPGDSKFEINVGRSPDGAPLADVLAHELGHVVGAIFDTPAFNGDPRTQSAREHRAFEWLMRAQMFGPTKEEAEGMLRNEEEAWEFAKKIRPESEKSAKWNLDTYRENVGE